MRLDTRKKIDLININGTFMATNGGLGFAAEVAEEINEARQKWSFDLEQKESITSSDGTILILKHVRPKIHEDHIHSKPEGRCGENHDGR